MTNNPKRRLRQHKNGHSKSTKRFVGNVFYVYLERLEHRDKKIVGSMAWHREKQVKDYNTSRKKKLIRINQERTKQLIRQYVS